MSEIHRKCFKKTLDLMRGEAGNPYEASKSSDTKDNYIPTSAHPEYKCIRYSMVASTRNSNGENPIRVEVVFEKSKDRKWNEEKMKALKEYKDLIEKSFGPNSVLKWKSKAGIKGKPGIAYKVVYEASGFDDGLQDDNVDNVANWLAKNMLKLARAIDPYMAKVD